MTAIERFRALLDQRGVKYGGDRSVVYFEDSRGYKAMAYEAPRRYGNGVLCVHHTATPEQAVEATLGRGTCRMELPDLRGPAYTDVYVCSECGGEVMVGTVMGVSDVPKWCPWCGRKVEQ